MAQQIEPGQSRSEMQQHGASAINGSRSILLNSKRSSQPLIINTIILSIHTFRRYTRPTSSMPAREKQSHPNTQTCVTRDHNVDYHCCTSASHEIATQTLKHAEYGESKLLQNCPYKEIISTQDCYESTNGKPRRIKMKIKERNGRLFFY